MMADNGELEPARAAMEALNVAAKPIFDKFGPVATCTALLSMYAMIMENLAWQSSGTDQMQHVIDCWRENRRAFFADGDKAGSA